MGGGGDAPSVPIWDMAVLAGATLFISTLIIVSPWTQPDSYDLDGQQEVLTVNTGFSQAGLTFESACISDLCEELTAWVVPHDGAENWNGRLDGADQVILLEQGDSENTVDLNDKLETGEYRLVLDGQGQYTFEVTVNRTIPHEYVPAIFGSLLLIWGIWRKQQEED